MASCFKFLIFLLSVNLGMEYMARSVVEVQEVKGEVIGGKCQESTPTMTTLIAST